MIRSAILLLLLMPSLQAQDEWSEPAASPRLEWNGNLDVKYTLLRFASSSPMAQLQFYQQSVPDVASQYRLEPYLNATYTTPDVGFQMRLHGTYYDDRRSSVDLFEAFARYHPSFQSSLQVGKTVYTWGKGYAFNPAGFINSAKDPENPELAQAGVVSAHAEYVKSYDAGALQALSALVVVLPPAPTLSDRFADAGHTGFAVKVSSLIWDTDIDVMTFQSSQQPDRYGFDVSRNLLENLEVHAEVALTVGQQRATIVNGSLFRSSADAIDLLVGVRFLSSTNTTVIAEYYRQGRGLNAEEFRSYQAYLASAVAIGTPIAVQQALQVSQANFRTSTLMRDYVYIKVSQPEPFDWLYFTPSAFAILNVEDGSLLLSMPFSYKPATNIEFMLWPSVLVGEASAEFGSRQARQRLELWMRAFF